MAEASDRVPARAHGRRGPPLPALHVGHHGQAQGHHAHHRRLPHAGAPSPTSTCSTCTPRPTSTGARPTSAGSPGHSYIVYGPLANGATSVIYEGTPDTPGRQRPAVGDHRALRRHAALHRADRHPHVHEVGRRRSRRRHDLSQPAGARHRRRAHQPRSVDVVPRAHRRRALPDRRHVVADRDRRAHDHARCPASPPPSPARPPSRCPASSPRSSTTTATRSSGAAATSPSPSRGPACCAASGATPSATRRRTGAASRAGTSPATAPSSTTTATSGCSGGSTT